MSLPAALTGRPIAHRGLWRPGVRPENSLAAFHAACAAGYGVELDVQLTADGEAVVFHDASLDRMTTESGLVEERTAEALTRLVLLGGERQSVPLLEQTLQAIAGRSLVLIELKTPPGQEGPLEARVAELLGAYEGPAAVLSFNPAALATMARLQPPTARGLNAAEASDLDSDSLSHADFISINSKLSVLSNVLSWRARGAKVVAWTIRSAEQNQALAGLVDNVIFEGFQP